MDQKLGLLVRPVMEIHKEECQTSSQEYNLFSKVKQLTLQEGDQQGGDKDYDQEEQRECNNVIVTKQVAPLPLKLEIPSCVGSDMGVDDSNDGFKTPTSSEHKIPVILECPGAPIREDWRPPTKRKACRPGIMPDLSKELESLFPTPHVVDLGGGVISKRVKRCSETEQKTW